MIEIYAAVIGASIGIAGMTASGFGRRTTESRETVIRLTVAVENIAEKLDQLHQDMRADRVEIYSRLNKCETRITSLEARPD